MKEDLKDVFKRNTPADKKEFINFVLIFCAAVSAVVTFLSSHVGLFIIFFIGLILLFYNSESIKKEFLVFLAGVVFLAVLNCFNLALGSTLILVNSMIYCMVFNSIGLKRQQIMIINAVIPFCLIFLLLIAKKHEGYDIYYYLFTGEKLNPNTVGIIIFFIMTNAVGIINNITQLNNKIKIILCAVIAGASLYFIYKTRARTSLLASLVFLFFCIFRKSQWFESDKKNRIFVAITWGFVLLTTIIYIALYKKFGEDGIKILGKSLFSGREKVWIDAYRMIKEHVFFGSGNEELFVDTFESAHNSLLGIWKSSGLFVMLSFCIIYVSVRNKEGYRVDTISRVVIVAIMFIATFETVFNDTHTFFLCILPLLNKVAENNGEKDGKSDTLLLVR